MRRNSPRHEPTEAGIPWWLPVGNVAGVIIYAAVVVLVVGNLDTPGKLAGVALATVVFMICVYRLWTAAIAWMQRRTTPRPGIEPDK